MAWYRSRALAAGIGLIVLANAVALGGVLYNRRGAPDSTLKLTQRELSLPYRGWHDTEDSGLSLRLQWQVALPPRDSDARPGYGLYGRDAEWLDAGRLEALGVKVRRRPLPREPNLFSADSLPADVLLVLELDGPAYARQVEEVCRAAEAKNDNASRILCANERSEASRLFVVDAGLDRDALRKAYPDSTTYAIVRGRVRAGQKYGSARSEVVGYIDGVAVEEIEVPLALRSALDNGTISRRTAPGRVTAPFEAQVAFGQRLEPWLQEIR